jgi:hypothetical protein
MLCKYYANIRTIFAKLKKREGKNREKRNYKSLFNDSRAMQSAADAIRYKVGERDWRHYVA